MEILKEAFQAAIAAAQPQRHIAQCVAQFLPTPPAGKTIVVGAGKAAATMAVALEEAWNVPLSGVVVTRYGHAHSTPKHIRVLEASHPLPDTAGLEATSEILKAVTGLTSDDLVICLLPGGGSALLTAPLGITLSQKIDLTTQLLACGASITEINTVRKHLSAVKGGGLAHQAFPARVVSLVVSDVVGDDLSTIASGPTAPDPTTVLQAQHILERYQITSPIHFEETPKPGDPIFERVQHHLLVTAHQALSAARNVLLQHGINTHIHSDSVIGPARLAAREHAQLAQCLPTKSAFLSGGETTTLIPPNPGRGGRNLEFLLALAIELPEAPNIYALAADTDGIDGTSCAAGAVLTPDTLLRAAQLGLDPQTFLAHADAHSFFEQLGDLVITGPTGTNVNDFRLIMRL